MRFKSLICMAERVGFEPTIRENRIPDFESGAFDHSATSPGHCEGGAAKGRPSHVKRVERRH